MGPRRREVNRRPVPSGYGAIPRGFPAGRAFGWGPAHDAPFRVPVRSCAQSRWERARGRERPGRGHVRGVHAPRDRRDAAAGDHRRGARGTQPLLERERRAHRRGRQRRHGAAPALRPAPRWSVVAALGRSRGTRAAAALVECRIAERRSRRILEITDIDEEHLWLAALDPQTGARESIDRPGWDIELACYSADGRVQAWSVNEDGYSKIRWRVDGRPMRERDVKGVCEDLIISADGSRLAFGRLSATEPWQVWTLDTASGDARIALTTKTNIASSELVEPELIRIRGPQGDIPCFIYRPKRARAPYPALLYPHGGPEAQSRPALTSHAR